MSQASRFCWYELMTTDLPGAQAFYAAVAGWTIEESGMQGMTYLVARRDGTMVAGLMNRPAEAADIPPAWLGYIGVEDVDATIAAILAAGGMVHHPPEDIPGVGRFAVAADPQGAAFALLAGEGGDLPRPDPMAPGSFGWHELYARDWERAFDFYAGLFGWRKAEAMDMGEMGTYQLFSADGASIGGMMNLPDAPMPAWGFYITVEDIDAAHARITGGGGAVLQGPVEVPGGSWIVQARDPQGAIFAISGPRG